MSDDFDEWERMTLLEAEISPEAFASIESCIKQRQILIELHVANLQRRQIDKLIVALKESAGL
jgi:hypothetical protein